MLERMLSTMFACDHHLSDRERTPLIHDAWKLAHFAANSSVATNGSIVLAPNPTNPSAAFIAVHNLPGLQLFQMDRSSLVYISCRAIESHESAFASSVDAAIHVLHAHFCLSKRLVLSATKETAQVILAITTKFLKILSSMRSDIQETLGDRRVLCCLFDSLPFQPEDVELFKQLQYQKILHTFLIDGSVIDEQIGAGLRVLVKYQGLPAPVRAIIEKTLASSSQSLAAILQIAKLVGPTLLPYIQNHLILAGSYYLLEDAGEAYLPLSTKSLAKSLTTKFGPETIKRAHIINQLQSTAIWSPPAPLTAPKPLHFTILRIALETHYIAVTVVDADRTIIPSKMRIGPIGSEMFFRCLDGAFQFIFPKLVLDFVRVDGFHIVITGQPPDHQQQYIHFPLSNDCKQLISSTQRMWQGSRMFERAAFALYWVYAFQGQLASSLTLRTIETELNAFLRRETACTQQYPLTELLLCSDHTQLPSNIQRLLHNFQSVEEEFICRSIVPVGLWSAGLDEDFPELHQDGQLSAHWRQTLQLISFCQHCCHSPDFEQDSGPLVALLPTEERLHTVLVHSSKNTSTFQPSVHHLEHALTCMDKSTILICASNSSAPIVAQDLFNVILPANSSPLLGYIVSDSLNLLIIKEISIFKSITSLCTGARATIIIRVDSDDVLREAVKAIPPLTASRVFVCHANPTKFAGSKALRESLLMHYTHEPVVHCFQGVGPNSIRSHLTGHLPAGSMKTSTVTHALTPSRL